MPEVEEYLIRMVNGEPMACEVKPTHKIPIQTIVKTIPIQEPTTFTYDNRTFTHAIFAEVNKLVSVIHCPLLKMKLPLDTSMLKTENIFLVKSRGATPVYDVYMKDVNIIVVTGPTARYKYSIYIATNEGKSAQLTNVYDDGRLCSDLHFKPTSSPEAIVSQIEAQDGNSDILLGGTSEHLNLTIENDKAIATPYTQRDLKNEYTTYLRYQNHMG